MKFVFLNTWGARVREPITGFITEQKKDTDIFCLQEAGPDMQEICKTVLFDYSLAEGNKFVSEDDQFDQSTYARPGLNIVSHTPLLETGNAWGFGLYTHIMAGGTPLHLVNVHGFPRPGSKLDTPERIFQSETIIEFMRDKKGMKIIGGDFNLLPETKSVSMFEENGYRNLIKDYSIQTTRNRLTWEKFPDNEKQFFADFCFVSSDVDVTGFSVPHNEVSDHLPMLLEISLG